MSFSRAKLQFILALEPVHNMLCLSTHEHHTCITSSSCGTGTQIDLVGMLMSYWQASYHNHFPLDQSLKLEEGKGLPHNSTLPSYPSKSFGIDCDS